MPIDPTLPTTIVDGVTTGRIAHTQTVHGIVNGIYRALIGTPRTSSFTLAQADTSTIIPCNSGSPIVVTCPVLQIGTWTQLVRMGTGSVSLVSSGTTIRVAPGRAATPQAQYCSLFLVYLSTTEILVDGDLT